MVNPTAKRRRYSDGNHHSLLPGLPDHIAQICLSLISPTALYSVCQSWRRLIYSVTFPPFRSLYTLSLTDGDDSGEVLRLSSFDPIASKWITVEPPPLLPNLRHPSFMSRSLPVQSVSVSGNLLLLAATSGHRSLPVPAFPFPLIFNPISNTWSSCPPLPNPRRWCASGALQDTVVVASGIGSHYTETVARSVEKWVFRKTESLDKKPDGYREKIQSFKNLKITAESFNENRKDSGDNWVKMRSLKHSKLCREAIDAVGMNGKLFMVNVKGDYAKEGFVYELDSDEWSEMPAGMLGGWRGPTAAMDEETMYVVDESRGVLRRYDEGVDSWSDILADERLKGAEYIAAGGGRVCVVCEKAVGIVVVDVVATQPRLWVVETPPEHDVLALHILPRTSLPEFQPPVTVAESK
ncbi:hypothetical protein E3N88_11344 [Mikania micrantha]|uniref:F-box domain-containing protein n=1 Tax=Mikania micrantha TaxID=192012 RepID=A0A5N6PDH1_9ASTR|nr:hypothetical protein E3N88_11344 [Mikania micrantha]